MSQDIMIKKDMKWNKNLTVKNMSLHNTFYSPFPSTKILSSQKKKGVKELLFLYGCYKYHKGN